jgi:hypothetical protein
MRGALFVGLLLGCGGAVTGPIDDASVSDTTTNDAPHTSDVTLITDVSPVDCMALLAKIDARRQELKVCCPFCGQQQCTNVVQDLCCPFSATATNVTDFTAMVAQAKQYCPVACPNIPCPPAPSKNCMAMGMNSGICQ